MKDAFILLHFILLPAALLQDLQQGASASSDISSPAQYPSFSPFSASLSDLPTCFPALFAFGDDWADTGNARTLYPTELQAQEEVLPYGMTFFREPAHRLSDGRLMIDFIAQALEIPLLHPYAVGLAFQLRHGMSFAVAGSTASLINLAVPYPLVLQAQWAQKYHSDVMDALNSTDPAQQELPDPEYFEHGLYAISAGHNDYRFALLNLNLNLSEVQLRLVPWVVENITTTIGILAATVNARNFLIMNLLPLGCTPEILTAFASTEVEDYDEMGCLKAYNDISALHNGVLFATLDRLRMVLTNTSIRILYADLYQAATEVMIDPQSNGFESGLFACCGVGDPYNYNPGIFCGRKGTMKGETFSADTCNNPEGYVSWDGVHTTEAFNRFTVQSILSGKNLVPQDALNCQFNFSNFKSQVVFK